MGAAITNLCLKRIYQGCCQAQITWAWGSPQPGSSPLSLSLLIFSATVALGYPISRAIFAPLCSPDSHISLMACNASGLSASLFLLLLSIAARSVVLWSCGLSVAWSMNLIASVDMWPNMASVAISLTVLCCKIPSARRPSYARWSISILGNFLDVIGPYGALTGLSFLVAIRLSVES